METETKVPAKRTSITLKRLPKHISRMFGRRSATEEQLVLVASANIKRTRKIGDDAEADAPHLDALHLPEGAESQALLLELVDALDTVHDAAQVTIAAADRNLARLEQCTRGLRSTLNILLASNELALAHSVPAEMGTVA